MKQYCAIRQRCYRSEQSVWIKNWPN